MQIEIFTWDQLFLQHYVLSKALGRNMITASCMIFGLIFAIADQIAHH